MGYLRFFLVIAVVHGHFVPVPNGWWIYWHHLISLFGFYTLSGFLITRVTCEIYNGTQGRVFFLLNRFMRIYPTYWVCLLFAIIVRWLVPETANHARVVMLMPSTLEQWVPQWTIFGLSNFSAVQPPRVLLAPAWSLGTELVYYLIIGLLTGRSLWRTWSAFALSVCILIILKIYKDNFYVYYFTIHGPAAIFFLGSLGYHYRHIIRKLFTLHNTATLLLIANVVIYLPDILGMNKPGALGMSRPILQNGMPVLLYITSAIFILVIVSLCESKRAANISPREQFFADISYPMYLMHWPVGILVQYLFGLQKITGHELFFIGGWITFFASCVIVYSVELPIKKIRVYLRMAALKNIPATTQ